MGTEGVTATLQQPPLSEIGVYRLKLAAGARVSASKSGLYTVLREDYQRTRESCI